MGKAGGLLLAVLVAVGLLGAGTSAGADELPTYDGSELFPVIHGPDGPEEFSWRVDLQKGQELRQIDDQEADVLSGEEGGLSWSIKAELAHDASGASVPTTLAVTAPDVVTLTVHHREGNPAAAGAPFQYPVSPGAGFVVGDATVEVTKPKLESLAEASPASTTSQRVRVVRALGEDKLYYRPHFFLLSGDGSFGMTKVQWKRYGGASATATARAFVNDCIPYCAAGHIDRPRAKLTLSKVVDCNGTPIYARLEYSLAGPLPKGFPRRGGYSMRPLGEDGKPEC